jgi:hypothetical protein
MVEPNSLYELAQMPKEEITRIMPHRFAPNESMFEILNNIFVLLISKLKENAVTIVLQKSSTVQCAFRSTTGSSKSGWTPRGLV